MILGFVTKTGASPTYFSQSAGNMGDTGGVGYIARKPDGTNMGSYQSAGQARNAFETMVGRDRLIRWERQDMRGGIEQHVAIGTPLTPAEIWGADLRIWFEPAFAVGSAIIQTVVTNSVRQVSDLSQSGSTLIEPTVADQPILLDPDPLFNQLPTLMFDGVSDFMSLNTVGLGLTPPFTMVVVTNFTGAPTGQHVIDSPTPITMGVNGAGLWRYDNGGVTLLGPAATPAPGILSVKQNDVAGPTAARFRVDGALVGFNATPLAAGAPFSVGGFAPGLFWPGSVAMIVVASTADADDVRLIQTERWAADRFQ